MTSVTGYSIRSFLDVAGCGSLRFGINILKHIDGFSRSKELGSRGNLLFLVGKRE